MHALIIKQDQLALPAEIVTAMWEELTGGGVRFGTFYVGTVNRLPDTVYFLWHLSGEVPVSTTVPRESLSHPMLARIAVEEFLSKWNQIIY
jgi:hypothetical protein